MNKTKKMIATVAMMSVTLLAWEINSFAATSTAPETGTIQITDSTATGGGGTGETLDFDTSPGVGVVYSTAANEFAIATTSANAQAQYRLEYGIYSPLSGYYQIANENAINTTTGLPAFMYSPAAMDGTDPFAGDTTNSWIYMGNVQ